MKKIRKFGIILLLSLLFTLPCYAKTIKHNMAETTLTIAPKDKISLKIPGVKVKNVVWKSKNKSIAKVNKSGIVTGLKKGKTKITAKCYKITFTLNIIVENQPQEVKKATKTYNKLIASDDSIEIYLYKVYEGHLYLKFVNKTNQYMHTNLEYIEMNGETYNAYSIGNVESGIPKLYEIKLLDLGGDPVNYSFSNEKIKVFFYYEDADFADHVLNFNVEL